MNDPTYNRDEIRKNRTWDIAFVLSECQNDNAPIGWGKYIWIAESIEKHCDLTPRKKKK